MTLILSEIKDLLSQGTCDSLFFPTHWLSTKSWELKLTPQLVIVGDTAEGTACFGFSKLNILQVVMFSVECVLHVYRILDAQGLPWAYPVDTVEINIKRTNKCKIEE